MRLETAINALITAKRADGRAKRTLQDYRRVLSRFAAWHNDGIENLDRATVRQYVAELRSVATWSPSTVDLHVRYLRAFWNWLHAEGYTDDNLAQAIEAPQIRTREEELLTTDELKRLLTACDLSDYPERDKAFILMLVDTGLRRGEIMRLTRDQVHFEEEGAWMLIEAPKTDNKRYCFLGSASAKALRAYLDTRDDTYPDLWIGQQGPWSYWAPAQMLKRRAEDAGIDPAKCHMHAFRKIFATWWIERGGDEQRLMKLGGWSGPEMLRIYVKLAGREALGRAHQTYSPVGRLEE